MDDPDTQRHSRSTGSAPVLETARLRLRGHRYDDLPHCVALWSDPQVTKFISGRASTVPQTWSRMLAYIGHWAVLGFGYWAIEEKASNAFVGECGLADFKREIAPSMQGKPELGFVLLPAFHGKGYATEAASAAVAWADAHLSFERSVCIVDPRNVASLCVVRKLGYEPFEETLFNGDPVIFFARDRPNRPVTTI